LRFCAFHLRKFTASDTLCAPNFNDNGIRGELRHFDFICKFEPLNAFFTGFTKKKADARIK